MGEAEVGHVLVLKVGALRFARKGSLTICTFCAFVPSFCIQFKAILSFLKS
jgi:hypothetical protein